MECSRCHDVLPRDSFVIGRSGAGVVRILTSLCPDCRTRSDEIVVSAEGTGRKMMGNNRRISHEKRPARTPNRLGRGL